MTSMAVHATPRKAHAPSDMVLAAYASGTLGEAPSLLIASHLTLSPESRDVVRDFETLGGVMLEDAQPVGLSDDALQDVLKRLDVGDDQASYDEGPADKNPPSTLADATSLILPKPIQTFVGESHVDELPWRRMGPGVHQVRLQAKGGDARLLRIEKGRTMPEHGHGGMEWTLVLDGGFSDHIGQFVRGDVEEADASLIHQPVADDDGDCLCLAVTDAPLKMKGLARLMQPFVGI